MQIEYCLTWKEYQEAVTYRLGLERKKSLRVVRWVLLGYALLTSAALLALEWGDPGFSPAMLLFNPFLLLALAIFVLTNGKVLGHLSALLAKRQGGVHARSFTPKRLELQTESLLATDLQTGQREEYAYTHITEICHTSHLVLLMLSKSLMLVIPRRCFKDEAQLCGFLETIERLRRLPAVAAPAPGGQGAACAAPEEDGFCFSFRLDEAGFLALQYEYSRFVRRTMAMRPGFWVLAGLFLLSARSLAGSLFSMRFLPLAGPAWAPVLIQALFLLLFLYLFLVLYGRPKAVVRRQTAAAIRQGNIPAGNIGPREVKIDEKGVRTQMGATKMQADWGQLSYLFQGEEYWVFLRKYYVMACVPAALAEGNGALAAFIRQRAPGLRILK